MTRTRIWLLVVVALVPACDQAPQTKSDDASESNEVEASGQAAPRILQEFGQFLAQARSFQVTIISRADMRPPVARWPNMQSNYDFSLLRPNKFSLVLRSGLTGMTIICDGKEVYTHDTPFNRYTIAAAPKSLKNVLASDIIGKSKSVQIKSILSVDFLLDDNPYLAIARSCKIGNYLGNEEVDGVQCHYLEMVDDEFDYRVWIELGHRPLLRRIVGTFRKGHGQKKSQEGVPASVMVVTCNYRNWTINPDLSSQAFQILPAAGSKKINLSTKSGSQGNTD